MTRLFICGAGNPEGVRLARKINDIHNRWDQVVILDDDPQKQGQSILGIEIAGPFSDLERADSVSDEVADLVARTTKVRQAAHQKITAYGIPFTPLIDPGVDMTGIEFAGDITIYRDAILCANARLEAGSVIFARATVGHGSCLGRYCVVAPGAVINARVDVGEGVYIGTNASILPDLKIGPWATVGANSAVVKDVPAGATVMGVPAQLIVPGEGGIEDAMQEGTAGSMDRPRRVDETTDDAPPDRAELRSEALRRLRIAQEKYLNAYKPEEVE